jgi:flagellar biosynthesis protein FlhF
MRLKLFRAPTVNAAIAQVRRELGADALILSTRRVQDGVEVTAALEGDAAPPPAPPAPVASPTPSRLAWHGVSPDLQARLDAGPLEDTLATTLRFGTLPLGLGAPPLLLTGPPGAGKTLTTARLATRLTLAGTPPLVVTADGRRAGAAEQLAAFTRVLGLPLLVADEPVALSRALARRERGAPALIDSAGLDPFDPHEREELAGLAGAAGATLVLVLPAGLDPAESADLANAFAEAGTTLLVPTRLDLARRLGGILAAAATGHILTEAGVGPGAADGLRPLTAADLAERLMAAPGHPQHLRNAA